ncbi:PadR family transcriptional regulator [Sporosarcina limicola]|uniref:DNA-binding PadR family transcriptional regulator n=1 Tax=Sporosarcina limicola TaxID=34101 RepID=A0A927MHC1_9BACL|nr:PadR family transcriptional regulator [Sporosarcina limicola]MBE1553047.1 DNA-binding PadR family transcriptional regulator [Sporosarcina limicola]
MNSQDVILGTLMKHSLSGYEIKQLFEDVFSFFYGSSYGTIYPMLNRLEKEEFITKEIVLQDGKPNKNMFTITENGRERFNAYLHSPMESDTVKSDFLTRLYFGEFMGNDKVIAWLRQAQEHTQKQLDLLSEKYSFYKDEMQPSHIICIEIGLSEYSAKLEIIRKGLAGMEQLEQ